MQRYSIVLADALFQIGVGVISTVLYLDEQLPQTLLCPKILSPFRTLLPDSVLPCQDTHIPKCFANSRRRFRCEVMFENQHTFVGSTQCLHLHSFCATDTSSGLATVVILTRVLRWRLGEFITREWTCFWFLFCDVVCDSWIARLNGTFCIIAATCVPFASLQPSIPTHKVA
jgi:hypothetical protein